MNIKKPSVAGMFYSKNKEELQNQIEYFKNVNKNTYEYKTRAVIVPHAGLIYSGRLAFEGISQIDRNIKNIFIFGPSHHMAFNGIAITSFDAWETPLGSININRDICIELQNIFNANINDKAFAPEHSIEVELPIIQSIFDDVKIIPILVGNEDVNKIKEIINYYYPNKQNAFIISSDLSHFFTDKEAKKIDGKTARLIESGTKYAILSEQACGHTGITGLINFANQNNFSLIRIDQTNSAEISNDPSSVVGYGAWFLFEGTKNDFLKQYYSKFIIDLCKKTLLSAFGEQTQFPVYPQIFNQFGACFVTLEEDQQLRGCIGSIIAYRPLIEDITEHTKDAAFNDSRFMPLEQNELQHLEYSVSLLSTPTKVFFENEQDLLNKIVQNKDGIIIKDKGKTGVYLPVVWEQFQKKQDFLNSLKVKAGFTEDYFSNTLEAYKFEATSIKEEK